jgi:hypothetical protein
MIYRTFQLDGHAQFTIQIRSLDGVSVVPEDLTPYRATRPLSAPWGTLPERSVLVLAPDSAQRMLAAGTIEPVPEAKTFENFAGSTDRPGGRSMLAMG